MRNAIGCAQSRLSVWLYSSGYGQGIGKRLMDTKLIWKLKLLKWGIGRLLDDVKARRKFSRLHSQYRDYSMVPKDIFIENLYLCHRWAGHVDGSAVECGVWRGGMSAAMTHVLGSHRKYYLFDSFAGLPPAKDIDGEGALKWQQDTASPSYFDNCRADIEFAEKA